MGRKKYFLIAAALLTASLYIVGCQKERSQQEAEYKEFTQPIQLPLKLQQGMKIFLKNQILDLSSTQGGGKGRTTLVLNEPSGAEGLSFTWSSSRTPRQSKPESQPSEENQRGQVILQEDAAFFAHSGGQLSLPNLINARRMTLPLFWPKGDLFLSNSAGIWVSDVAFEELKKNRKAQWQAGLLKNPLLGPVENLPLLHQGISRFAQGLQEKPKQLAQALEVKAQRGTQEFPLKVNGKKGVVSALVAQNFLFQYKILDNAQNPLVLELTLAPEASFGEILFSPLALIKGWVDYRVVEIQLPSAFPSQGTEELIQGSI